MIIALIFLVIGIVCGQLGFSGQNMAAMDMVTSISLAVLVLSVGIDIGQNKGIFQQIRQLGFKVLLLPLATVVGTLLSGFATALAFGLPLDLSMSVVSGMGFSSVAAAILKELAGVQAATVAFFSNILRSVLARITVPWIARHINFITAIAPGGVTSMDMTLPVIYSNTDSKTVMVAVIHGALLTALAPVLIPFMYSIF